MLAYKSTYLIHKSFPSHNFSHRLLLQILWLWPLSRLIKLKIYVSFLSFLAFYFSFWTHVKQVNVNSLNNTYTQPFDESSPCTSCGPCHPRTCGGNSWSDCIFLCLAQVASPTHARNDPSCLQGYQCFQFATNIMNTNNSIWHWTFIQIY